MKGAGSLGPRISQTISRLANTAPRNSGCMRIALSCSHNGQRAGTYCNPIRQQHTKVRPKADPAAKRLATAEREQRPRLKLAERKNTHPKQTAWNNKIRATQRHNLESLQAALQPTEPFPFPVSCQQQPVPATPENKVCSGAYIQPPSCLCLTNHSAVLTQ